MELSLNSFTKNIIRFFSAMLMAVAYLSISASLANAFTSNINIGEGARSYNDAVNRVNWMCSNGYPAGHAGYISSSSFDTKTGHITWNVTVLNKKCPGTSYIGAYAVTGYDGLCPVSGWYHNGLEDTHDCIKFGNPALLHGVNKCNNPNGWPVNTCGSNWWRIVYGGQDQPSTNLAYRTFSFDHWIADWNNVKTHAGEYKFIDNRNLCSFYRYQGVTVQSGAPRSGCQLISASVSWDAQWDVDGFSYIGKWGRDTNGLVKNRQPGTNMSSFNVRPNQTLSWDHDTNNQGPDDMVAPYSYVQIHLDYDDRTIGHGGSPAGFTKYEGLGNHSGKVHQVFYWHPTNYTILQSDVNKQLCQRISWFWESTRNHNWGKSTYACANVPYDYRPPETPPDTDDPPHNGKTGVYAVTSGDGTIFMGDNATFDYKIVNRNKSYTRTKNMPYRIYTFILKPEAGDISDTTGCISISDIDRNGGGGNNCLVHRSGGDNFSVATPTSRFGGNVRHWKVQESGNSDSIYPASSQSFDDKTVELRADNEWADAKPGDRICSYIAVDQWAVTNGVDDGRVRLSNIKCYDVGKKPQLQIRGGDSKSQDGFAGSTFKSTTINPNNKKRGSLSQYGLISLNNSVSNFGSAGYTAASGNDAVTNNNWCKLIYANTSSAGSIRSACGGIGNFDGGSGTYTPGMPTVDDSKATTIGGNINLGSLDSKQYKIDGNANISGSLRQGVNTIIKINGNATINTNIGRDIQKYANLEDMPNLTLYVTGQLTVSNAVSEVNATIIANKLNTCVSSNDDLGIVDGHNKCNSQLKINGSVIATGTGNSIQLKRTFGSGNNASYEESDNNSAWSPSEIINLSPNTFLTTFAGNNNKNKTYRITEVRSLPARY